MKYYLAPMEGITGYIFRRTQAEVFGGLDKYFTPFLSPNGNRPMSKREREDVLPEHNPGLSVIPQILTNQAEHFLSAARELAEMGYREVNLNLGCPSGTVTAKKRGSGFLAVPQELDSFFSEIFEKAPVKISVKTRLGVQDPEEFMAILDIYERYPLQELIIHPRVQKDFYKNQPRREMFCYAQEHSRHRLCYNGDLFTEGDILQLQKEFPRCDYLMLGRGILVNPALPRMLSAGTASGEKSISEAEQRNRLVPSRQELFRFQELLAERYYERMTDDRNVLFKMKELWFYLIRLFDGGQRYVKKLRKVQKLSEYRLLMNQLFAECPIVLPEHVTFI